MSLCGDMNYTEGGDEGLGFDSSWEEKRVKPRKERRCCECSAVIGVGEECGFAKGLYDGQWMSWYRCPACMILAELAATVAGECPLWGGLDWFVSECLDEPLPSPAKHRELWEWGEEAQP